MYKNNHCKFVAVLNKNIDVPKLMNALAHCSSGLATIMPEQRLQMRDYVDGSGGAHRAISEFPWIILQSRNSSQMRDLRAKAQAVGLEVTDFVHTMLGESAEQQMDATQSTSEADLTYYAVCMYGEASILEPITKKFSVFRMNLVDPTEPVPVK